jgi:hypothetical protein
MTPSRIEHTTFWFVVQCRNCATATSYIYVKHRSYMKLNYICALFKKVQNLTLQKEMVFVIGEKNTSDLLYAAICNLSQNTLKFQRKFLRLLINVLI